MQTAVISGIDKGLGLALTTALLHKGYTVYGGHHEEVNTDLQQLKEIFPRTFNLMKLDIGSDASVDEFCQWVHKTTEKVDLLINNAGILGDIDTSLGGDLDFNDIMNTVNVNAIGMLRMVNGLLTAVLGSEEKTVLNICSEAGSIGDNKRESWFGYCMSKAAMNMGGSIVHQTLKKAGGRVVQMHPGYLKTYMHGYYNNDGELTAEEAAGMILEVLYEQQQRPILDQPVYISSKGERLPW